MGWNVDSIGPDVYSIGWNIKLGEEKMFLLPIKKEINMGQLLKE
jgi:hypothetical protein